MTAAPVASPAVGELSLLDRMVATLGPSRARDELKRTPLQSFVEAPLPEGWGNATAWDALSWIWPLHARPAQLMPDRPFRCFLLRSGRGYGKNRAAAEAVNQVALWAARLVERGELQREEARILLVGRSAEDVRDSMILGPSGVVARSAPWFRAEHQPGRRRVVWLGGLVEALAFSAAEADQVRGQNGIFAWCDEVASWGPTLEACWRNVDLAVRIGPKPRIICTTTPKPLPWLRALIARPDTIDVCRPTSDNTVNLGPDVVKAYYETYGGWIAAQELEGQIVDMAGLSYFSRADVQVVDAPPTDVKATVRAWDLAATRPGPGNPDPDWTFGVRLARRSNGRFVILHAVGVRELPGAVEDLVLRTAAHDGEDVPILLPQDPGQAGKAQIADLVGKLAGYSCHHEIPTGPKEARAMPLSSQWQHGNVEIVRGSWNEPYLAQMEMFPSKGCHDDAADASASAFNFLAKGLQTKSMFDDDVLYGPDGSDAGAYDPLRVLLGGRRGGRR